MGIAMVGEEYQINV